MIKMICFLAGLVVLTIILSYSYWLSIVAIVSALVCLSAFIFDYKKTTVVFFAFSFGLCLISSIFSLLGWCVFKDELLIISLVVSVILASTALAFYLYLKDNVKTMKLLLDKDGRIVGQVIIKKFF